MFRSWLVFALVLAASPVYAVSLTGYYKLDDVALGPATATIGTNGTYVGSFVVGDLGQAGSPGDPTGRSVRFQYGGTNNRRIEVLSRGGTPSGTNFTISMWVQFATGALSRDATLVNNEAAPGVNNINIFRDDDSSANANDNMITALVAGDPRAESANNSANDTNWHLISVSKGPSPDSTQIFIDGVRSSFQTANNAAAVNTNTIGLGNALGTNVQQFEGMMDEVGFWSRALNASEQQALFVLNTNNLNNIDAAGAAALLDFFEDGSPGGSTTVDGTNFMFVPDVTAFGGIAGQSALVGSRLVLGLNTSGTSGLISVAAVPEPASVGLWALLGAVAMVVTYRRLRQR